MKEGRSCLPGILFWAAWILGMGGCGAGGPDGAGGAGGRLVVFAAIEPVAWLVERVGGERVEVHVLVQAGADPHTFQLAPRQMAALARAAVYFKTGLSIEEPLLERIRPSHPELAVVDTAQGIARLSMSAQACCAVHGAEGTDSADHAGHDHAGHDHDDATGADPHVWLAPALLKIQAENIAAGLATADPEHATAFRENLAVLRADLDALDARIRRRLAPYKGRTFYVFHPAFGYFAQAYGLKQAAVEVEGKAPSPKQLRGLIEQARADGATVIFAQPQYDPRAAQIVAEAVGAQVATVNDLRRDVAQGLEDLAGKVAGALGEPQAKTDVEAGP